MLFLLKRIDGVGYDEYDSMLISEVSEYKARRLACENCADEGGIWADEAIVTCEVITPATNYGIIINSFNAG